ncbi:hypothetical protein TNCT_52351 [Trichonephila clavata]|uniref:Uncharacterized protein n=1 Tax=Trichonephila clavata TaxID=2740835 RepID=A0A8X6G6K9_TRICU|nr:hypothetical protein TNCT_52351 [Trichonephila clavata]
MSAPPGDFSYFNNRIFPVAIGFTLSQALQRKIQLLWKVVFPPSICKLNCFDPSEIIFNGALFILFHKN